MFVINYYSDFIRCFSEIWTVANVTNDTINLIWDEEPSDEYYAVETDPQSSLQVNGNNAVVSGLDAGVVYSVNVSAVTGVRRILLFSIKQITGDINAMFDLQLR